jgi:hypothetical protein
VEHCGPLGTFDPYCDIKEIVKLVMRVDFTEKELIEIINNTCQTEEYKKFLLGQIQKGKIIPIRGYGYGKS